MTRKEQAPPGIPAEYCRVSSRPAAGPGGGTVEEYAKATPDEAVLRGRLCAWLQKRKGDNP